MATKRATDRVVDLNTRDDKLIDAEEYRINVVRLASIGGDAAENAMKIFGAADLIEAEGWIVGTEDSFGRVRDASFEIPVLRVAPLRLTERPKVDN